MITLTLTTAKIIAGVLIAGCLYYRHEKAKAAARRRKKRRKISF